MEHQDIKRKLEESEILLKETQKLGKMGAWSWDVRTQTGSITDAIFEIYGKQIFDIESGINAYHPDDRLLLKEAFNGAIFNKKPYDLVARIVRDNGEMIFIRTIGQPKIKAGKVVKVFGILMDITQQTKADYALKKSRKKLTTILKTIPDFIFHLDKNGKFVSFYQENISSKLLTNPNNFIDKTIYQFFEEELAHKMKEKIDETIEYGEAILEYELDMGEKRHYESRFSKLNQDEVVASVRDISERKISEQKLKDNEKKLREYNATKDKFFSIIAHDLRNPFANILGLSDLLISDEKRGDYSNAAKYLELINSTARTTLSTLDNILQWAQSQTGQIKFSPEKINLSKTLKQIIRKSDLCAQSKNITITQDISEEIEVVADLNMLNIVLRNLISNAIKFTNSGGEIIITTKILPRHIEVKVSDNGVGISDKLKDKLFNVVTNKTSLGTAKEKGSGLGLVLCEEFVRKNGGIIWVESNLGKGSDFIFTIPR